MGFSFAMLAWVDFFVVWWVFSSLDYFPLPHKMLFIDVALSGDQHPVFGIRYNGSDNVCPLWNYDKILHELFHILSLMALDLLCRKCCRQRKNSPIMAMKITKSMGLEIKDFERQSCPGWSLLCGLLLFWALQAQGEHNALGKQPSQTFSNTTELDLKIVCFYFLVLLGSVFSTCHQNHPTGN